MVLRQDRHHYVRETEKGGQMTRISQDRNYNRYFLSALFPKSFKRSMADDENEKAMQEMECWSVHNHLKKCKECRAKRFIDALPNESFDEHLEGWK